MKRKKFNIQSLPDIINKSSTVNFTQIPNELLRDPSLSFKAKGILCLLLSNKEGWHSYLSTIQQMTCEGITAIRSGISELEKAGYLMKIQYREKQTKVRRGSFWVYTDLPGNFFNMEETLLFLEKKGLEAFILKKNLPENLNIENLNIGSLNIENQRLIILMNKNINDKNINDKNTNIYLSDFRKSDNVNGEDIPSIKNNKEKSPPIKERNKQYLPIVEKLSNIIQTTKNIKHTPNQLRSWSNEVRQLVEGNGISSDRINKALEWYEEHVGEEYVPVIESGSSLREKFIKLENAMQRGNNDNGNKQNPTNSGTRSVSTPPKDKYARALARRKRRAENNRQEA